MSVGVALLYVRAVGTNVAMLVYEPRRFRQVSIVVGHGYSSSKHNLDALCAFLAGHGFGVVSVDFPGHKLGASGGVLNHLTDLVDTLAAAAQVARERFGPCVYALGHSMGAMTALRLCAADQGIAGAVSIATGWGRLQVVGGLMKTGTTDLRASYVDGLSLPQLLEQAEASNDAMLAGIAGRPVLYIAAERDGMVSPQSVRELYERAPEPKRYAVVDSDHTYAGERARSTVLAWLHEMHPRLSS